ncbi:MAG: hypothetical protein J7K96_09775 [Desulfobacteraceae bacterium]|nr:hypothetical protein [Desulfobacteraceae bacterium]
MMETIVFGNFTVMDILIAAGVIIGVFYLWPVLKRILSKKGAPAYAQVANCKGCGWQGQVSMHAGRCPKCNKPLGDQKAKEYR